jgi:psiF repeat
MLQRALLIGLIQTMILSMPASALTAQEKAKTCKFGADDQKLVGTARKIFISKCLANEDAPTPTNPPIRGSMQ